jgi:hypothetical protein
MKKEREFTDLQKRAIADLIRTGSLKRVQSCQKFMGTGLHPVQTVASLIRNGYAEPVEWDCSPRMFVLACIPTAKAVNCIRVSS